MNSLTITAYWARKIIKYGGSLVVILVVSQWILATSISLYKKAHPPEDKPDYRFGKLTAINFPSKQFEKKIFKLQLPDDKLPVAPKLMRVYAVQRPANTLLALEQAKKMVAKLGFVGEPLEKNGSGSGIYEFRNDSLNQVLTMSVLDGSFTMKYPYLNDQLLANPEKMPLKDEAISIASAYLSRAGVLYPDLSGGEKKVSYYKISFDKLEPQSAPNGSNIARVDFYKQAVEVNGKKYKILPSDPNNNSVSLLVTGSRANDRQVVDVNFKHSLVDAEIFGKYQIKTPQKASQELMAGNYFPAKDLAGESVIIHDMYLAYYEPEILDKTMQPIYVFEDEKGNFMAYVTALEESL